LHCLNGVLKPLSGKIFINSCDIASLSQNTIAKQISLVPQEHIEIFPFKVIDVVVMGRTPFIGMTKTPGKLDYKCAMEALQNLNAQNLAKKNFNRISGGERQIVLLAMALAQASKIMLLDEPTNHLDFNNQYLLLGRIKNLCKTNNLSVVASMHDPNMAMFFADKVIMIKNNHIIAQGPACKVMTNANISELYDTKTIQIKIDDKKSFFLPEVETVVKN
ncbi:MAG: ABC transporter ATP-binding protein, partial [Desulfobacula sp.]|nr:ABC transporter ATP-binding protein [Desulfobacula sp.]